MAHDENNKYYQARKATGLSVDKAIDQLFTDEYRIPRARMYRIEEGKTNPYPEEVCAMANAYKVPELKNYYCNFECKIGQTNGIEGVGDIDKSKLPQIVLELLSQLNSIQKDKLIDISADGEIDDTEKIDFLAIRAQLDKISQTVESLRLWADKHIEK
ncbi:MAG: XRE family transcriptional regulator [Eubacterium sp.]